MNIKLKVSVNGEINAMQFHLYVLYGLFIILAIALYFRT